MSCRWALSTCILSAAEGIYSVLLLGHLLLLLSVCRLSLVTEMTKHIKVRTNSKGVSQ